MHYNVMHWTTNVQRFGNVRTVVGDSYYADGKLDRYPELRRKPRATRRQHTGLSALAPEISGKQLELLKDIIPKLKRVAVVASAIAPDRSQTMNEMESAAKALRLELEFLDVSGSQDVEPAFYTLANRTPGALVVLAGPTVIRRMTQITGLAANRRLPVIYHQSEFVDAGGLISYGVNLSDLYRRTAIYVDKY